MTEKSKIRQSNYLSIKNKLIKTKNAGVEAAASYPEDLPERIDEAGTLNNRYFNVDKTAFSGKKTLSEIFIAREEKSMPGFKAALLRS